MRRADARRVTVGYVKSSLTRFQELLVWAVVSN